MSGRLRVAVLAGPSALMLTVCGLWAVADRLLMFLDDARQEF